MAARIIAVIGVILATALLAWVLFIGLPRWYPAAERVLSRAAPTSAAPAAGRKIKAQLFYVSADGTRLTSVERDVPYGEGAEQAREIMAAQLAPASDPLVSAVPAGTALRGVFLTDRGDAYVNLSSEFISAHPGGSLNELLTVYTIVNALTANLPAVHGVQILVEGREVATLAGHVDLRQPLVKDLTWVQ
jgi:spore germination protein GerM